jgi:hypothetical protein
MTNDDAVEFLDANKVEQGIRNSKEAGTIIYTIMVDLVRWKSGVGTLQENSGVAILSTSRKRNIRILRESDAAFVPIGVVQYIPTTRHLYYTPRKRFEDDHDLVTFLHDMAHSSLVDDPELAAVVRRFSPKLIGLEESKTLEPHLTDEQKACIILNCIWCDETSQNIMKLLAQPGDQLKIVLEGQLLERPTETATITLYSPKEKAIEWVVRGREHPDLKEKATDAYVAILERIFVEHPTADMSIV